MFSWGVWPLNADASWGAYRFHQADGALMKYRYDILERSSVSTGDDGKLQIMFHDLLLDVFVKLRPDGVSVKRPGGEAHTSELGDVLVEIEDDDEVEQAKADGLLSLEQQQKIGRLRREFLEDAIPFLDAVDRAIEDAIQAERQRTDIHEDGPK